MPLYNSNYEDAANALGNMGGDMNQLALMIARQRYGNNTRAAQLNLAYQRQQDLNNYRQAMLARQGAGNEFNVMRAQHQGLVDTTAQNVGQAVGQYYQPPVINQSMPMIPNGNPLFNVDVPTQDIRQQQYAQIMAAQAQAAALAGRQFSPAGVNIPQNDVRIDPFMQAIIARGNVSVPRGGMVFPAEGGDPMSNPISPTVPRTATSGVNNQSLDLERIASAMKNMQDLSGIPGTMRTNLANMGGMAYSNALQRMQPQPQMGQPQAQPQMSPQGKPITDQDGKTWLYLGGMPDPTQDKDPSHWKAQ